MQKQINHSYDFVRDPSGKLTAITNFPAKQIGEKERSNKRDKAWVLRFP